MSHWQPERLREKMAWSTSRIATVRGRPTVLTGIRGWMISHGSSVRSEGSGLRIVACPCVSVSCGPPGKIIVYEISRFPDSLLHRLGAQQAREVVFVADGAPWIWTRLD